MSGVISPITDEDQPFAVRINPSDARWINREQLIICDSCNTDLTRKQCPSCASTAIYQRVADGKYYCDNMHSFDKPILGSTGWSIFFGLTALAEDDSSRAWCNACTRKYLKTAIHLSHRHDFTTVGTYHSPSSPTLTKLCVYPSRSPDSQRIYPNVAPNGHCGQEYLSPLSHFQGNMMHDWLGTTKGVVYDGPYNAARYLLCWCGDNAPWHNSMDRTIQGEQFSSNCNSPKCQKLSIGRDAEMKIAGIRY